MGLPQKLKELRSERAWTQLELAKRSGLNRGYIANLEGSKSVQRPSADAFLKLARAFNIRPEELYEAAGYIKDSNPIYPRPETHEEILDRLKLATPQSIPIYPWEAYPFHLENGPGIEPIEYVYRTRTKLAPKNIQGYRVHGDCLEPKINDGDIIIIDRDGVIDNGDFVACVLDDRFHVLRVRKVASELWLEDNHGKFKYEQCHDAAPVIEVIRRLK
jgi:transcriptional regulator with XRE-family HTH domain